MKKTLLFVLIFAVFSLTELVPKTHAQTAETEAGLTELPHEFMEGASKNDASVHERFWADDLIYTSSDGQRFTRADILQNIRSSPSAGPDESPTVYHAEEIRIQQYGDMAVVAFRLVATTQHEQTDEVAHYLNTGTFLKRNGQWQAVSWQATSVSRE